MVPTGETAGQPAQPALGPVMSESSIAASTTEGRRADLDEGWKRMRAVTLVNCASGLPGRQPPVETGSVSSDQLFPPSLETWTMSASNGSVP